MPEPMAILVSLQVIPLSGCSSTRTEAFPASGKGSMPFARSNLPFEVLESGSHMTRSGLIGTYRRPRGIFLMLIIAWNNNDLEYDTESSLVQIAFDSFFRHLCAHVP